MGRGAADGGDAQSVHLHTAVCWADIMRVKTFGGKRLGQVEEEGCRRLVGNQAHALARMAVGVDQVGQSGFEQGDAVRHACPPAVQVRGWFLESVGDDQTDDNWPVQRVQQPAHGRGAVAAGGVLRRPVVGEGEDTARGGESRADLMERLAGG